MVKKIRTHNLLCKYYLFTVRLGFRNIRRCKRGYMWGRKEPIAVASVLDINFLRRTHHARSGIDPCLACLLLHDYPMGPKL